MLHRPFIQVSRILRKSVAILLVAGTMFPWHSSAATVTKSASPYVSYVEWPSGTPASSEMALMSGIAIPSWMDRKPLYQAGIDDAWNAYFAFLEYVGDYMSDDRFSVKVRKFSPTFQPVSFPNGQSELVMETFSYPSNGNNSNFPTFKVFIRVEPSGTMAVAWQAWSESLSAYVAKFAAIGNDWTVSGPYGNVKGAVTWMEFAQMDLGSYVVSAYEQDTWRAKVFEFFSKGPSIGVTKTMTVLDSATNKNGRFLCEEISGDSCSVVTNETYMDYLPFVQGNSAATPSGRLWNTNRTKAFVPQPGNNCSYTPYWSWMKRDVVGYRKYFLNGKPVSRQTTFQTHVGSTSCNSPIYYATFSNFSAGNVIYPEVVPNGNSTFYSSCSNCGTSVELDIYAQEWGGLVGSAISGDHGTQRVFFYSGYDERYVTVPVKEIATVPLSSWAVKVTANRLWKVLFY